MLQSVVYRLVVFSVVALLILAAPLVFLLNTENAPLKLKTQSAAMLKPTQFSTNAPEIDRVGEEPVIQLASLSVGSESSTLEILEPMGSLKSDTMARVERASELSKAQRFSEALEILDGVHVSSRDDYSVKFLEARILSWTGQHRQAEQEFDNLRALYPEDLDVLVSFGYLQLYQRKYSDSEKLFAEVLELNPDYADARRGLERSKLAQRKQ